MKTATHRIAPGQINYTPLNRWLEKEFGEGLALSEMRKRVVRYAVEHNKPELIKQFDQMIAARRVSTF